LRGHGSDARWIIEGKRDAEFERILVRELECASFVAALLCGRGIATVEDARAFLDPRLSTLSDPFLIPNMRLAVDRILAAIDRRQKIVLYGDYDVDGVTSLALFVRALRVFGVEAKTFLPMRMEEGYGLSASGVQRCVETLQPELLIAVDCGTCSCAEIASLRARGIDVVVFDHHECGSELPDCAALVNPHLGADFHYLCSVGLVFKASHALLKLRPVPGFDLREHLDLVALGTVADIVPLISENRTLVRKGLQQMEETRWPGVRALIDVAAVRPPIRATDVGFKLGPRLNAAGRLDTAEAALELLLTEDSDRARELASKLNTQNSERQQIEKTVLAQAETALESVFVPERDAAIVLGETGWHPGVLGIVASRLCKKFHRPTILIGFDEAGLGKGSGRSIEGFSLVEALRCCGDSLEKYGGHEMAAGLAIRQEKLPQFQSAFLQCASSQLDAEALRPRLRLHAELTLADISFALLAHHDSLQPFGSGNAQPTFIARGVRSVGEPRILKEKHLRIVFSQNGRTHPAIYFNGASANLPAPPWDIAFTIERNEYEERVTAQIQIIAVRAAA
jgi:single-stranded-DNA-specific exonuclease